MTAALSARILVHRRDFDVDLALEVAPGETVAVMGRSGAGKSTLLGALAGLVALDDGEIAVDGRVLDRTRAPRLRTAPMHRGIVLLGQDARLFPHLSVRENVAFGPRAAGVPASDARPAADAWLERVGLGGTGGRRPAELSGGEQQRVAVARALAAEPRVVLLDEPLVALDAVTAAEIRAMLRDALGDVTTVAVTHDAVDAAALGDRLLIVERGRITQQGTVREVLSAPATDVAARIAGLERIVGRASDGAFASEGVRLNAADAASRAVVSVEGAAVAAVYRAADVQLRHSTGEAPRPGAWTATVTSVESTPWGVRVVTPAGVAEADAATAAEVAVGDRVELALDPARVRFVPAS